jgi:hypothetical protein
MAHRAALILVACFDHQHGIVAAAESNLGNFHPGVANGSVTHLALLKF